VSLFICLLIRIDMRNSTSQEHAHSHSQNRHAVLPTPLRLGVDGDYSARGVTIAFLDSGFYPHPDLTEPMNRIVAFKDISRPGAQLNTSTKPETWDWHGTMTAVSAAGNGFLSDGLYRGLASEASVVLVKVSDEGKISEQNIERGLRWVIQNKERYDIRVVSISLGGDREVSYKDNAVDQAAEEAVRAGIAVVAAAGNSGCTNRHQTVPPANAPSVITVGGYNDNNTIGGTLDLYCSSYGETPDGIVKPELLAPAMWVAAPILPRTEEYSRAEALSQIASSPDYLIGEITDELWRHASLPPALRSADLETIRAEVNRLLEENKIIATHYQHVDGTSFAAPVIASLITRMIEANTLLTPAALKHILISTANRIVGADVSRQGYGVVNARRALEEAKREQHFDEQQFACPPRVVGDYLEFVFHDDSALSVSLVGDFNRWDTRDVGFVRDESGVWRTRIESPVAGRYQYKLVVDESRWIEDPANLMKAPDGFGGYNSVLHIT